MADVELVEGSILDQPLLARVTKGCKFVLHQGALDPSRDPLPSRGFFTR